MELDGIVRRARAGDEGALSALCEHYHPILCQFFAGLLRTRQGAEDLAQDTLIAMLRALPDYRQLPGKRFEGWLMRIGYNRFIDQVRKRRESQLSESYDVPDPGGGAEEGLMRSEHAAAVREAMMQLDDESRAMVTLRYELDLPYKDIATALGTTQIRVKWRLNDALKKLKKVLEGEGFEWTNS